MRALRLSVLLAAALAAPALADEPFLKPNDVIALVGGEDMVAAAEYGYLELLLTRALPAHKLRFRCLAWEGDTVFEQRRDLNFPTWEEQLEKIGATVVICQFGKMESFSFGNDELPQFLAAYESLADRLSKRGLRRMLVLTPTQSCRIGVQTSGGQIGTHLPNVDKRNGLIISSASRLRELCDGRGYPFVDLVSGLDRYHRDGVHLNETGHLITALKVLGELPGELPINPEMRFKDAGRGAIEVLSDELKRLLAAIRAKNRLWDRYWRVQNWAFLAGDRVHVASSRDHLDPSKRWFPAEREEFLPLIEKKEQEIWALAAQLK